MLGEWIRGHSGDDGVRGTVRRDHAFQDRLGVRTDDGRCIKIDRMGRSLKDGVTFSSEDACLRVKGGMSRDVIRNVNVGKGDRLVFLGTISSNKHIAVLLSNPISEIGLSCGPLVVRGPLVGIRCSSGMHGMGENASPSHLELPVCYEAMQPSKRIANQAEAHGFLDKNVVVDRIVCFVDVDGDDVNEASLILEIMDTDEHLFVQPISVGSPVIEILHELRFVLYNCITILYAFFAIPYAAPPIDELRFQEPQSVHYKPNIIYNATQKSPSCIQDPPFPILEWIDHNPKDLSEDCLYLNIWIPSSKPDGKPLATMVWIHGGSFHTGSSNMNVYDGSVLAAVGNVIVVTFNYRLAALSFASFNDEDKRGNMGMLDQVVALKWVQENIENFEGDKNLITVFGQIAGAVSIDHHIISPLTKGLFNRVILQSGSNYLEYCEVNTTFNIENTVMLSQQIGCNVSDTLTCMREKNAYEIVATEKKLIKRQQIILYYHPQVGPPFLSDDPFYDIEAGKFHDVQGLMGDVKDEGTLFVLALNPYLAIENKPIFQKQRLKIL
ncbi:cholinesterase-like [Centruroides vittatus]|uniref:cholinesterase-like n=1 Tax=Centruroides vittatus TaxID=120091 RepID=UPI00350FF9C7